MATTSGGSRAGRAGRAQGSAAAGDARYEIDLKLPFRLDATVSALRRLPSNLVDVYTADGEYLHAFAGTYGPLVARVTQPQARTLAVHILGDSRAEPRHTEVLALVRRSLGVDRDVRAFARAAAAIPWLHPMVQNLRGLRPPRYRSLWEAFINAVVFQQVSLHAANAVVRRMVMACGAPVEHRGTRLYVFPDADQVLASPDATLRTFGLSAAKIATLRRVRDVLASGELTEAVVEKMPSPEAAELLCGIKGIGPWTAAVILLRGFGRLDVFPMNDSGVARNLAMVAGVTSLDVPWLLKKLGDQKGMLYFHLLLARLVARGEVGMPSVTTE